MSGPELRRDLTPNLSSPSQHYTFDESEDGDINNSVADSSTQSQNMNGATSTSISKSARYQTALTARARQRQMRRMLEREGSGGESPGSAGDVALTPREGEYRGRGRNEISPSTPGSAATPTSELMRLRALLNSNRSSNSENSDHTSPDSQMLATLYEKHRGRSLSRTREAPSLPTSPLEDCSNGGGGLRHMTRSPSSPNLGASELPKLISPPTNNPSVVTPQQSECDNRNSGGIDNGVVVRSIDDRVTTFSKQQHQQQQQQNQFRASPTTIPPSASSLRQQRILSITPNEEFLPDWNATKGGGLLSTTEVQDAANFTSIQFQLSITSGEVEMLSGDDASCQNNQCWQNEVWSDVSPPSPLASGEIFHKAAAASIVSLLSPNRMAKAGLMAPEVNSSEEDDAAKDVAGDSPTGVIISPGNDGQSGSVDVKELFTFNGNSDPSLSRGGEWEGVTQVTRSLFRGDVDEDVRQSMVFQAFRGKMIDSSPEFSQLLSQINRKRGTSIDRAFAIRRKNACGALKILSAKEENRIKICWTVGVLPAIASVLSDVSEVIPDEISRAANTEARNRIVSTLLNMSVNKKNRMLIVNTPGILESISQTILHDAGEGRQGCCAVLLYLAKTSEARGMIVKSAGMMDALAKVIEVPKVHPKSTPKSKMRKQHLANIYESPSKESGFSSRSSHSSVSSQSGSRSSNSASGSEDGDDSVGSVESTIAPGEVEQMEISFETADTTVPTSPKSVAEDMYDADPNRFLHGARLSVFACLLCLVKSQENSFLVARDENMINTLIGISKRHSSPSHARAMAILAHLTRHPKNCHLLVFKYVTLLLMLQEATTSTDNEARRYAFCALQNLSIDKACRAPIAHTPKVIWSLTQRCKDRNIEEEWMAALATLQNLSDEPANLIQFTIVNDCIGTIIQIAGGDVRRGEKTDLGSFMAKNTLATLSHWFRKIATSGSERCGVTFGGLDGLQHAKLEPTSYSQWT